MPVAQKIPDGLRPFAFHGVHLRERGQDEADGDCPFCGREGKFGANTVTGLWQCKRCQAAGNIEGFLQELLARSEAGASDYDALAADRGLLYPETLMNWGVCQSFLTGDWLVPGYTPEGKLCQLYRYRTPVGGKKPILLPTPGMRHGLLGVPLFDRSRPAAYVAEGPWDAMVLWEAMRGAKPLGAELVRTGSEQASLLAGANVLGVPTCSTFPEEWAGLFAGKDVTLLFDNDHPMTHPKTGEVQKPAAYGGMQRVAALLGKHHAPPTLVRYLRWGEDGADHDSGLPHGYDIRDALVVHRVEGRATTADERCDLLAALLARAVLVPEGWGMKARPAGGSRHKPEFISLECTRWKALETAWRKAMRWRQDLGDVLATMLAVCASTSQVGDQVFLQVIGDAGSGKTRFCDGLVVSKQCYPLEHLTGFHSGWKGSGDEAGQDFSLIARINHKTLVTPEGDVMMSSPKFQEIMSQQRRIFDGTSGASFKNKAKDDRYTNLRTPWIIAGTPALMASDQSRLGDRFLRVCIGKPDDDERVEILRRVHYGSMRSVATVSNGAAEGTVSAELALAYRLTGGYVDHLRQEAPGRLAAVEVATDADWFFDQLYPLADFVADMRARPDPSVYKPDSGREVEHTKEVPSRLLAQLNRLGMCLAVVLDEPAVNRKVMRVVRKVALDTARGRTLDVARVLAGHGQAGLSLGGLHMAAGGAVSKLKTMLDFLRSIQVVESYEKAGTGALRKVPTTTWRLTPRFATLYRLATKTT